LLFHRNLKSGRTNEERVERYIHIISKNGVDKVPVSEISWIESEGHRLIYHTRNQVYESTIRSMKEIENELKDCNFFRCNKGYLVNLAHVRAIRDGWAILSNGQVMISRSKKTEFQKALTTYAGENVKIMDSVTAIRDIPKIYLLHLQNGFPVWFIL